MTGPDDAHRLGPARSLTRGGVGLADELLGYGADVYVEEPARAARRRSSTGCAAVGGGGAHDARAGPSGAKDQVARLLTLVPYLHARGAGAARGRGRARSASRPSSCVNDLKVLFMCGLPGGYPDDLIDVDLDALEGEEADGVIRVSNADYLARPLRLTPTEATAMIVALRALRDGAGDETREVVDRALAKLEAAAAEGAGRPRVDPGDDAGDADRARRRGAGSQRGRRPAAPGAARPTTCPSRDEESERVVDPRGVVTAHGLDLPRRLVPQRRGAPAVPARPDRGRARCSTRRSQTARRGARATSPTGSSPSPTDTTLRHPAAGARRPAGSSSTTRSRTSARSATAALEVDLLVADERWLHRLLLRLAPHARVRRARRRTPRTFTAAAQDALSALRLTAAYDGRRTRRPTT